MEHLLSKECIRIRSGSSTSQVLQVVFAEGWKKEETPKRASEKDWIRSEKKGKLFRTGMPMLFL